MPIVPVLHLNGTSPDELLSKVYDCMLALSSALNTMHAAEPNARDYYPRDAELGEGVAFQQARAEYGARLVAVRKVYDEFVEIYEAVNDEMDKRNAQR